MAYFEGPNIAASPPLLWHEPHLLTKICSPSSARADDKNPALKRVNKFLQPSAAHATKAAVRRRYSGLPSMPLFSGSVFLKKTSMPRLRI